MVWVFLVGVLLVGCGAVFPSPAAPPSSTTTRPPTPTLPPGMAGWQSAGDGLALQQRQEDYRDTRVRVTIVRIDPARVQFRVGYNTLTPPLLSGWCSQDGVVAVMNGGFFQSDYQSTALVIQDGVAHGSSYQGAGGMFAVDTNGAVSLRSLAEQPYAPDEPLVQAVQGWPMLVNPGGRLAYTSAEPGEQARRSVVAIDRAGHVLLMAFWGSDLTLHELAAWLVASDLEIDAAVNMDGGSSTGLCVRGGEAHAYVDAFTPLPLVVLVSPR